MTRLNFILFCIVPQTTFFFRNFFVKKKLSLRLKKHFTNMLKKIGNFIGICMQNFWVKREGRFLWKMCLIVKKYYPFIIKIWNSISLVSKLSGLILLIGILGSIGYVNIVPGFECKNASFSHFLFLVALVVWGEYFENLIFQLFEFLDIKTQRYLWFRVFLRWLHSEILFFLVCWVLSFFVLLMVWNFFFTN